MDWLAQSCEHALRMSRVVRAIESVVALPAYRDEVLATAPAIARHDPAGAKGVFFGYDFHVGENSFGLIEINTNAGGAMLNAVLARAQRACCAAVEDLVPRSATADEFEDEIVSMFRKEWLLSGHERPLRSIAIVDENPEQQYLYPEFLLLQRLFERHGLQAVVAGPNEFILRSGMLWHGEVAIDLVDNRLTDFSLAEPASATLCEAYLANAMVLTPHPQAHALYADKRNLALLGDAMRLQALGVPQATQDILLASIPHTEVVEMRHAERLWEAKCSRLPGTVTSRLPVARRRLPSSPAAASSWSTGTCAWPAANPRPSSTRPAAGWCSTPRARCTRTLLTQSTPHRLRPKSSGHRCVPWCSAKQRSHPRRDVAETTPHAHFEQDRSPA